MPEGLERFMAICRRERCPAYAIGEATGDGRLVLQRLRQRGKQMPVLVITDRPDSSIPIVAKRATIGGGAAGTLAGLRSGTGCISPIMAEGAAFCLTANRTGFGSGAVCGGPVVLFIATFFAIGSTCCQGAAFGRTLMPVVGTIAGPLGSPLVNMGGW